MEEKKTVGQAAIELQQKTPDSLSPIDNMREQLTDYESNVLLAMAEGKKKFTTPFYIVVLTKKEKLLENVLRNYFMTRQSCPTPSWDQTVYHVKPKNDQITFLWTIPSRDTVEFLWRHRKEVVPEEYPLLNFVVKFVDGTLDKLCMQLNGELT